MKKGEINRKKGRKGKEGNDKDGKELSEHD